MRHLDMLREQVHADVQAFDRSSPDDLPATVQNVEAVLTTRIGIAIFEILKAKYPAVAVTEHTRSVHKDGVLFQLLVGAKAALEPGVLMIALLRPPSQRADPPRDMIHDCIPLAGHGRYSSAEILIDSQFKNAVAPITNTVQVVIQVGYEALLSLVRYQAELLFKRKERELAYRLYAILREAFSADGKVGYCDRILFGLFTNRLGVYLFDNVILETAIRRLDNGSENESAAQYSKLLGLGEILSNLIPYDQTLGRGAISTATARHVDLEKGPYVVNFPAYLFGEENYFGTSEVAVFPIVFQGDALLISLFPSEESEGILDVLRGCRGDLAGEVEKCRGWLLDFSVRLRQSGGDFLTHVAVEWPEWAIALLKLLKEMFL